MKPLYTNLLLSLLLSGASASVTVQFSAGAIRGFDGNIAPIGSKGVLVANTGSDGFLGDYITSSADFNAFNGTSLTVGSVLGGSGNDEIVGVFDVTDFGDGFIGFNDEITFNLGSVAQNQQLALYWFPTISTTSISGSLTEYGFFRSDSPDSGADVGFIVQADGSNDILAAVDSSFDTTSPSSLQLTSIAVPEPSSFAAIAGIMTLGFVMVRRRRA